jgi:uncharacterized membrane protein (DUF373 family)
MAVDEPGQGRPDSSEAPQVTRTSRRVHRLIWRPWLNVFEFGEDAIHLFVAALLSVAAAYLIYDALRSLVTGLSGGTSSAITVVLTALDNSLVLFILAEVLHTVRITFRDRELNAEPFLVIGLIAGIRRVLVLTASSEQNFTLATQGVELIILTGLILVMALAILVWRRSGH